MLLLAKAEDIAVSLQMTLIWPFKVTKDPTDHQIRDISLPIRVP